MSENKNIIYKSKDKTYVECTLKQSNLPIGVAIYKMSGHLSENMKEMLLETEEIVRRLKMFEKYNLSFHQCCFLYSIKI